MDTLGYPHTQTQNLVETDDDYSQPRPSVPMMVLLLRAPTTFIYEVGRKGGRAHRLRSATRNSREPKTKAPSPACRGQDLESVFKRLAMVSPQDTYAYDIQPVWVDPLSLQVLQARPRFVWGLRPLHRTGSGENA